MNLPGVCVFDLETTGVDPETARIVTAAVGYLSPNGEILGGGEYLVNPGVEIPAAATAVHGISTAKAIQDGLEPLDVLNTLAEWLSSAAARGIPLVVFNAPYDLTVLDREIRRHRAGVVDRGVESAGIWWPLGNVLDPYVIDKALDTYRKGSRRLADVAALYGIPNDGAHNASADAIMAGRLALRLAAHSRFEYVEPHQLHAWQITWKAEQAESFAEYQRRRGLDASDIRGDWPLIEWKG